MSLRLFFCLIRIRSALSHLFSFLHFSSPSLPGNIYHIFLILIIFSFILPTSDFFDSKIRFLSSL